MLDRDPRVPNRGAAPPSPAGAQRERTHHRHAGHPIPAQSLRHLPLPRWYSHPSSPHQVVAELPQLRVRVPRAFACCLRYSTANSALAPPCGAPRDRAWMAQHRPTDALVGVACVQHSTNPLKGASSCVVSVCVSARIVCCVSVCRWRRMPWRWVRSILDLNSLDRGSDRPMASCPEFGLRRRRACTWHWAAPCGARRPRWRRGRLPGHPPEMGQFHKNSAEMNVLGSATPRRSCKMF